MTLNFYNSKCWLKLGLTPAFVCYKRRRRWEKHVPISNLINGLLQLDETANRASNKLNHLCPICKCIFKRGGDHLEGNQGTLKEEATAVTRLQCYKMSWSPVRVLLPHFAILNFLRPMFTRLCLCSCVIIFLRVHHVFPKVAIFLGFFFIVPRARTS